MAEFSARHKVHLHLITKWKRQSSRDGRHEAEIKELHAKIGDLTVEKDILSKALGRRAAAGEWK